jgi:PrtD family type I secretion system ABC transporter
MSAEPGPAAKAPPQTDTAPAAERTPAAPALKGTSGTKGAVAAVVLVSLFINLLMFVAPIYMLQVYDRVLLSGNRTTLIMLTVMAVAALLVYGLLDLMRARILARVGEQLDADLGRRLFFSTFRRAVRDPQAGHGQALRDLSRVREFLGGPGLIALCDAPWVPLFIALVFAFHVYLGVVALVAALVIFALAAANEFLTRSPVRHGAQAGEQANTFLEAGLRNAHAAAAMGMRPHLADRWQRHQDGAVGQNGRAGDLGSVVLSSSKALRMIFQVAILGVGAWLVLDEAITAGTMIAASIVMGRALAPVEMAVGQWRAFVNTRAAYGRVKETLRTDDAPSGMPLPAPTGVLSVEQAIVVPPGGRTAVVNGASFNLAAGEMLGIIGPSGAGKSSLARALLGVWPVVRGSVRLDGAEVWSWDSDALGPYLGYLPQDIELFDGTVAENIARFGPVDHEAVVRAAKLAGVHETVLRLSDGYDTRIGPGGQALSGGQQRGVALARALYGDVRLVVLDEPNANLDSKGELQLLTALQQLKQRGTTTVVITHRPQILKFADRIAVLRDGKVHAIGPRTEMLERFVMGGDRASSPANASSERTS